jgi:hypothetical protein
MISPLYQSNAIAAWSVMAIGLSVNQIPLRFNLRFKLRFKHNGICLKVS